MVRGHERRRLLCGAAIVGLGQQPEHHIGRERSDRTRHAPQHRLELMRGRPRYRIDDAPEHPHQDRRFCADAV